MYDLVVIGGGSGGVAAARRAASYGARVALCEEREVGGTCVHRGCIPKKLMMYAAQVGDHLGAASAFGWEGVGGEFHLGRLRGGVARELERLEGVYLGMLERSGVELVRGRARVAGPHSVEVAGRRLEARHLLLATGGRPSRPSFPGAEEAMVSDDLFRLEELPESLLVVGSGYIGCEFSSILQALGSRVTQMFRSPLPLPGFDGGLREALAEALQQRGVRLVPGDRIAEARKTGSGWLVRTAGGLELEPRALLLATGRVPNSRGLGLEEVGVELDERGAVRVDPESRTRVPSLFAVGDLTDRVALTPVAIAEGRAVVETLFRGTPTRVDHGLVPKAVFTLPPVATVGRSEEQARAEGRTLRIFQARFRPMKHTLPGREERVFTKLVVDAGDDRVLGAHMVGDDAPEIVQSLAVALRAGATKRDFDQTMALHPSSAEEFVLMREPVA